MKLKYILCASLIIAVFAISTAVAFPLKSLQKEDTVKLTDFESINKNIEKIPEDAKVKLLLLWRNDKRTSVEIFEEFVEMCGERSIPCVAVDLQKGPLEKIKKMAGEVPENIYFAHDKQGVTDDWGIFTLPVTIFLDSSNKVVNAIGYEGQYVVSVGRYIDLLTGKISEEKYNSLVNTSTVDKSRSKLPKINFIKKLIKDGQKEDAKKRLEKLDKSELTMEERLNLSEVYLLLEMPEEAEKVLDNVSQHNVGAKFYRAYALYQKKELDKSLELLHSIENIYPQKSKVFYLLGEIYKEKGDYKEAAKYFEKSCNVIIL